MDGQCLVAAVALNWAAHGEHMHCGLCVRKHTALGSHSPSLAWTCPPCADLPCGVGFLQGEGPRDQVRGSGCTYTHTHCIESDEIQYHSSSEVTPGLIPTYTQGRRRKYICTYIRTYVRAHNNSRDYCSLLTTMQTEGYISPRCASLTWCLQGLVFGVVAGHGAWRHWHCTPVTRDNNGQ